MNIASHRLSISHVNEAVGRIDPVFLNSPQYICESLSDHFDLELTSKVEMVNPIRSFKGRGAEVLVSKATPNEAIVCASAGNFGQAMAYSCRKKGLELTVYASIHANPYKLDRMRAMGAKVVLAGIDFDEAKTIARKKAEEAKSRFVEDSQDIETLVGTGTIALELLKLPYEIEVMLVSLGNGALLGGITRVMKELSPRTKIVAVQAIGAPAMIESLNEGKRISHPTVNTIADGIAVRLPVQQALDDLQGMVDDFILVKDESTIAAMKLIHAHMGLVTEPSGAIGVGALLENKERFKGKKVATILCGGNLTAEQIKQWIV